MLAMIENTKQPDYFFRELGGGGSRGIPPPDEVVPVPPDPRRSVVVNELEDGLLVDLPGILQRGQMRQMPGQVMMDIKEHLMEKVCPSFRE